MGAIDLQGSGSSSPLVVQGCLALGGPLTTTLTSQTLNSTTYPYTIEVPLIDLPSGCVSGGFTTVRVKFSDSDCLSAESLGQSTRNPNVIAYVFRIDTHCQSASVMNVPLALIPLYFLTIL